MRHFKNQNLKMLSPDEPRSQGPAVALDVLRTELKITSRFRGL